METPFGTHRTNSPEETQSLGAELARHMRPPLAVMLSGDLGAGKTTLTKGLVAGLGSARPEDVASPTFSLIHEYEGPPKVYHVDLYRLDKIPEVETLGLEDVWEAQAIVLVEWGEKFLEQLPGERWEIAIRDLGADGREIEVRSVG